jgi:ribosomal protein S18 acetylase RimI-like enzyme
VKIRKALVGDLHQIIEFQLNMAFETEKLKLNSEVLTAGVNAVFNDSAKGQYYVAEAEEGRVVASLLTTYEWSDWRNATVIWIQSVYVHKDFRNQSIFKRMYAHVKSLVSSDNSIAGIRLYVDKSNISAQNVYAKIGMSGEHYQVFEDMKS